MTVQEICDKLRKYYEDAYKATIQDRATFLVDLFPESLDTEFTKDIILELRGKLQSKDTTMGEAI